MTIFVRYISRQLFVGLIMVTAALTAVLWLSQSLRYVDLIVNRGLDAGTFLMLILLLLPNFMVLILPVAVVCTVLFTYTRLTVDREIVVLGACGTGPWQLVTPAVIVSAVVALAGYILYTTIIPQSFRSFREMQWEIRYGLSSVLLEQAAFSEIVDNVTVYVRERSGDQDLRGIFVHDTREKGDAYTIIAESGVLQATPEGARVTLFNGSRQSVDTATHSLSILYFERYALDLSVKSQAPEYRYRSARELTLAELFNVRTDATIKPSDHGQYLVEAHRRLTSPLSTLGYGLIGAVCLVSGRFRRGQPIRQNVVAVGLVTAIALVTLGSENLAARDVTLIPLIYVCNLAPIAGALAWLLVITQRGAAVPPFAGGGRS